MHAAAVGLSLENTLGASAILPPESQRRFYSVARQLAGKAQAMSSWTPKEHLAFDIAFALKKVTIPGFKKALTEDQRFAIAKTILEHLKLCRWEFSKPSDAMQSVGGVSQKQKKPRS